MLLCQAVLLPALATGGGSTSSSTARSQVARWRKARMLASKSQRIFASPKAARSIARHRQNYARATSWRRGKSRAAAQILSKAGIRRDLSGDLAYFGYPFPAA